MFLGVKEVWQNPKMDHYEIYVKSTKKRIADTSIYEILEFVNADIKDRDEEYIKLWIQTHEKIQAHEGVPHMLRACSKEVLTRLREELEARRITPD